MRLHDGMRLVDFIKYLSLDQQVRLVACYVELDEHVKNYELLKRSCTILEGHAGGACMIPYDNYPVFGIKFKY